MTDKPIKKQHNVNDWFKSLTPEQQKAQVAKMNAVRMEKRKQRLEIHERAKTLMPTIQAEAMLQELSANQRPTANTLMAMRQLMDQSKLSLDDFRARFVPNVTDEQWKNLTKYVFEDEVASPQQLGYGLVKAKQRHLHMLQRRIKMIEKEMRLQRKIARKAGEIPKMNVSLFDRLTDAQNEYFKAEQDLTTAMNTIDVFDQKKKSKGGGMTINLNIPRPEKLVEEQDDAEVISLDAELGRA